MTKFAITIEQGIKISALIDKLGLKVPDTSKGQAFLGADLMLQIVSKAHKASNEIYDIVSEIKGCTKDEAKKVDLVEFITELSETAGLKDFLSSAVTSQATE